MRGAAPTIRSRLVLLVLVATLPMLVFSAALLQRAYRVSAGLIEQNALGTAARVAAAVDAKIGRAEASGMALSQLPLRDAADLAMLEDAAARALESAGLEAALAVADRDGQLVADTLRTNDEALGHAPDPEAVRRVFDSGRPLVTGVSVGRLSHEPEVSIHVPLLRGSHIVYDMAVKLPAGSIIPRLALTTLPEEWFVVISDETGSIVWDTSDASQAGAMLPAGVAVFYADGRQEFGPIRYRNKQDVLLGFVRLERIGWTVGVGMPAGVVFGPLKRSIAELGAGAAAVLLGSLGVAWAIGRSIILPLGALQRQAMALTSGRAPKPSVGRGLAEAAAAGQALHEAAAELRAREADREAARRRAETSEARLLLAQEVGQIGTWEIDLVTGARTWSQQMYELYARDPALGPPKGSEVLALLHPEDRPNFERVQARARAQPMNYQQVFRLVRPDGRVRWMHSAARSDFANGTPLRLIGTTMDNTERIEAERLLRESATRLEAEVAARTAQLAQSEERFRTYFQHSSDALVVVRVEDGPRFVYESINQSAERLFGLQQEASIGRTPDEMLPAEFAAQSVAALKEALSNQAPITLQRTAALTGDTIHIETVLMPVFDPQRDRIVRIISGSRDLTERQRVEARLAHAQRMEAVGQLTGGVAHDFNNLLTVVIGNLSLLRRRLVGDTRAQRYLTSVEAAAERGAKLTTSLLAFSRRQALQVEQTDVGERIRESTTLLRRALGEAIEFEIEIEPDLPPADADASKLEAAVLNLVINARDAIEEAMQARDERSGWLRLRVHAARLGRSELEGNEEASPGRFVAIVVEDRGAGMPAAVRARAFEPFFTTKIVGRGTGLGLSQVFGFVRQLGGHVTIDSVPDQGTRVTMFLPVAVRQPAPPLAPAPEPPPLPKNATVLVVEDDPSIRDVTAEMLRDAGLLVRTASNGVEALDILQGGDPVDLLFTDVVMPGGATGIDLARTVRALRPELAVLLTSGYDAPALSRFGGDHDHEVLAKPYTRSVLLARIGAMLTSAPVA